VAHTLYLDFETRSTLDIRKVGLYRYIWHPSTELLCVSWAEDGDTALVVAADEVVGMQRFRNALLYAVGHTRFVAHNFEFELECLKRFFLVTVDVNQWSCTAARAARMSLPRSLEELAIVLGLANEKDSDGHKVMLKLSKPRRPSKEDAAPFWTPETKAEDFLKLYAYCRQDVETMREADGALPELSGPERDVWEATTRANQRGVAVDVASVELASVAAAEAQERLASEFLQRTGVKVGSSAKVAAVLGLPDVRKHTLRDALKPRNDYTVRLWCGSARAFNELVQLRLDHAKSSVKKLAAFANQTSEDGRLRGGLVYCGADRTGRWSGRGVQPQNFPKGLGKGTERVFQALRLGLLAQVYDKPLDALSGALRGFFVGPFNVGDYAQIEARVLAWLAGEESLLKLFRENGDPYCAMASDIYHRPVTKKDEKERFMGKQAVLGCGYGIGAEKFRKTLDEQHNVQVSIELAESVVRAYRTKYRAVVNFWYKLERAFKAMLESKTTVRFRMTENSPFISMGHRTVNGRPFAYVQLPSGRSLWYAYPELVDDEVRYLGRNQYKGGAWENIHTYGGKLAENIVQATSRDLLASAFVEADKSGLRPVLTVHDEIVCEGPGEEMPAFHDLMNRRPDWAQDLPLAAETFSCQRYRK
jgi:DNA polymerase